MAQVRTSSSAWIRTQPAGIALMSDVRKYLYGDGLWYVSVALYMLQTSR